MAEPNILICAPNDCKIKIIKWRVREGFPVGNTQVILVYENCDDVNKELKKLKATQFGVVKKRLYKDGAVVEKGSALLSLSVCVHTTVIKDMCADCGADLRKNENGNASEASVPMVHSVPDLKVTEKLAHKLGQADTKRLLHDRKLVLLVDLDQTVIHTTNDNVPNNVKGIYHFQLYGPHSPWYHTRLRPGTTEFLKRMSELYELHICTFGARNYAHMIAQLLDPDGKLFSHRILSRDECFNATSKTDNLKALFPCGDSMVCIIDDREDVWNMASNLIQVKPYHFFQHTGDINAPPGLSKHELDGEGVDFKDLKTDDESVPDKVISKSEPKSETSEITSEEINAVDVQTEKGKNVAKVEDEIETKSNDILNDNMCIEETQDLDVESNPSDVNKKLLDDSPRIKVASDSTTNEVEIEDPDDYLLYLEVILNNIYRRFYEIYDDTKEIPDLKIIVPKIRSEVLRNKNLVFSGLVPTNMRLEQSRAYFIAKSLGANVSQNISEATTHLVAVSSGTFKVNASKKYVNIKIVNANWLWSCAERWEIVDERLFPLGKNKSKARQPPAHCHSPKHVVNYSEKSEISSSSNNQEPEKFIDTINPLLSFSNADLADMNKEFDQFFESDSSTEDEHVNIENPPVDKTLRKRKRQEKEEERQRAFFSREQKSLLTSEANPEKEKKSSAEDDDEMPSTKFRRGSSGLRVLTKKYLYKVIKKCPQNEFKAKLDYLEKYLLSRASCEESQLHDFKQKISRLRFEFKSRWFNANRNEKRFTRKNEVWLKGSFDLPNGPHIPRRRTKSFEERCVQSKTSRTKIHYESTKTEKRLIFPAQGELLESEDAVSSKVLTEKIQKSPGKSRKSKKSLCKKSCVKRENMSTLKALSIFVEAGLSRKQYEVVSASNKKLFPSYSTIKKAKINCYPPPESYILTDTLAEINLQDLLDHTVKRLLLYLDEVRKTLSENELSSLELMLKWGCDGSQQTENTEKFENFSDSDANIFQSSLVPLRLVCGSNRKIVWQNPTPSSPRYCRPIRISFTKKSTDITQSEINYIQSKINSLIKTKVVGIGIGLIEVKHTLTLTMVDGNVFNAATDTNSNTKCYICGTTPKEFNDLEKSGETQADISGFGLSISHTRICLFESVLNLAHKLPIKKWELQTQLDKDIVNEKKTELREQLKSKLGLIVDVPKSGFDSINNGNTSRKFFNYPQLAAEITGVDPLFIYRLKVILEVLSSEYSVDSSKFGIFAFDTAKLYVESYSWHPMSPIMHTILIHGAIFIENALLPIGQVSEEAAEVRNKHFISSALNFATKFSRKYCYTNVLNRLLLTSDPLITSLRTLPVNKPKSFTKEALQILTSELPVPSSSDDRTLPIVSCDAEESENNNSDEEFSDEEKS